VYILDANLQPVPVGVTGELYIAGAGVTSGYVDQAEKTAERFVNNPFAHDEDSSAKMYRTGDLARYCEDGKVEFIGRGDDQVKVRGFRIELGEIETVLARHPGVKQALVVARADEQGEKRLVGYVVGKRELGSEITGEELRTYLKQQLPEYMVPQALVVLPKMPLNANGKIDRRALPEPEAAGATHAYVAPRTQTERAIAQIWAEVLRRDPNTIGVEDNFFDLGGHSLLATQVISRLRQQFSVEIPMRVIFDRSQVSRLAEAIEQARENSVDDGQDLGIASVSREAYRA
jgi:acyl carrier protein